MVGCAVPDVCRGGGRYKAWPYWNGWGGCCWLDILLGKNEHGGETGRGVAGAQPLHKGGPKARPPKKASKEWRGVGKERGAGDRASWL